MKLGYRRLYISLAVALLTFQTFGQNYTINWSAPSKTVLLNGKEVNVLSFVGAKHKNGLPVFTTRISGSSTNVTLSDPIYSPLSIEEASLLPNTSKSIQNINPNAQIVYSKGKPSVSVSFVPLKRNNLTGQISKLVSFDLITTNTFSASKTAKTKAFGTSSVLATGDWYKLQVNSTGIRKLDYNYLKNTLGIDVDAIDPQYIQIYGNHGGMLSQQNSDPRTDDLQENAIYVVDGADGSFDSDDYVLFFGQEPHIWKFDTTDSIFHSEKNIYSDATYYFLTIGNTPGKRISDVASLTGPDHIINSFNHHANYEVDLYNLLKSGREWFGDLFNFTTSRDYTFAYSDIVPGSDVKLTSAVMSTSTSSSSFTISLNGSTIATQSFNSPYATTGSYGIKGKLNVQTYTVNQASISGSPLTVGLTYDKNGNSTAIGYLDYLELNTIKNLKLYGSQTTFRSVASTAQSKTEFQIGNMNSSARIWEVTDLFNITNRLYNLSGSTASFVNTSDTVREYVVWTGSSFSSPIYVGKVSNQDLHAINTPPTLLIVTHPNFKSQADQLANFKQNTLGMSTLVVTTTEIYNEFSSGAQDISAIRDFAKMLYDRNTGSDSLRYLLLFGDASYDYKNRITGNTNFVPVYESRESLHNIDSYSSDDYFGFLDDSEGYWNEDPSGDYLLDIGVGRFPVTSTTEAQIAVDKAIAYTTGLSKLGNWRNRVTFVADDGDGVLHMSHANINATYLETNYPVYNINKIYLDAYVQTSSPSGEVSPDANQAIDQAIERGTMIMNYSGHGGGNGWAQEAILTTSQMNKWSNIDKLTLFVTATCEFGRYDNPEKLSGAENLILNPAGGAIALVTTTRPVFAFSNLDMNEAVYDYIFEPINDSTMPTLGDMIRLAKNEPTALLDINNRNFSLLGDPSLTLAYPDKLVEITTINDSAVVATPDTLKALSKVKITGEVRYRSGGLISDYNGKVYATVFDKSAAISTLGNEGSVFNFNAQNNIIYEGLASAVNGKFSFTFVVPKDISYQLDYGKISLYAKTDFDLTDAHGVFQNVIIGGSADSVDLDDNPPTVELFMDDESFVFGGQTGSKTTLIGKLSDDNGINISNNGIGHEITAILDENTSEIYVLNDFYSAELDDYTNGKVEFPFDELSEGNHSLKVKAWDTHNNSGEDYIEFVVANEADVALKNVLNYPNPFTTNTEFHFDHNRAGDDLEIMIQIYTISGRLIKTLNYDAYGSSAHISSIKWDGLDDYGDKIGKGVYVYKVNVRSLTDGSKDYKIQKLVILN